MKEKLVIGFTVLSCLASSAHAITNGGPDDGSHPYVGLAVMDDARGYPMWRCSGTLLSPRLFLTAGHCTSGASRATIWFEEDVQSGIPGNGYPYGGATSVEGTAFTHPQYRNDAFYLYDLGVIVLDEPVQMDSYGNLPELNQLDALATRRGIQDTSFTAVGYGMQKSSPLDKFDEAFRVRLKAKLELVDLRGTVGMPRDTSIMLTANANTGGTCFGDSGGPQFADASNTVVAVTSFGINGLCVGVGGGYRIDKQDDLDWLYGEFGSYLAE